MPFIKICGIQTASEARLALESGANALGFLVGLTHKAEDKIDKEQASEIVKTLPDTTNTVLVTHLLNSSEVIELARFIGVKTIQIHDDMEIDHIKRLRIELPTTKLIKAVHVSGNNVVDRAQTYAPYVDAILLDSRTEDRLGGTGQTHDWSISRQVVEVLAPKPVYLAGGLNPENVASSIRQVKPAGVDVNSGVEDNLGRKDIEKLKNFITFARATFAEKH